MYSMQNIAIIPPSTSVLYKFRIFTGSTCRTSRELSMRFPVQNSTVSGRCLPALAIRRSAACAFIFTRFGRKTLPLISPPLPGKRCGSSSPIFPSSWYAVAMSHLLRTPKLRTARPRIRCLLFIAGHDHVFGEHLQRSFSLAFLERVLHRPVFSRVVTHHHPSAA